MNRNLLAAPICALALAGILTGVAAAADEPRLCDTVRSELADAQAAATLPVTIDKVEFGNLDAVKTALAGLDPNLDAVAPLRERLQAILDAAARVTLLEREVTTCVEDDPAAEPTDAPDPTTDVPAPTTDAPAPTVDDPAPTVIVVPPADDTDSSGGVSQVPSGSIDSGYASA